MMCINTYSLVKRVCVGHVLYILSAVVAVCSMIEHRIVPRVAGIRVLVTDQSSNVVRLQDDSLIHCNPSSTLYTITSTS